MILWVLAAVAALIVLSRFARGRRQPVAFSPLEPISTFPMGLSSRQTHRTKVALDAADTLLSRAPPWHRA